MFIDNKYYVWYKQLVSIKNRVLDCYTEKHHIIPRCMGGDDSVENLVILTARAHYIAHLLLTKCTSSVYKQKMSYALWNMVNRDNGERTSSTNYSNVRTKHAKMLSENNSGSGNPMFGKQVSIETRQKISSKTKGGKRSIETRERISNANKGSNNPMFGIKKSEEFILASSMRMSENNPMKKEDVVNKIKDTKKNTINCFSVLEQLFKRVKADDYYSNPELYKGNNSKEAREYKEKYKGAENA